MPAGAAGHDAGEMRKIRRHVERNAMIGDPAAHTHADGGNLVLRTIRANNPNSHAAFPPFACYAEIRERADQPLLEITHEAAHVRRAPPQVEHDVGYALSGPVIGELPATARLEHRKARLKEV